MHMFVIPLTVLVDLWESGLCGKVCARACLAGLV